MNKVKNIDSKQVWACPSMTPQVSIPMRGSVPAPNTRFPGLHYGGVIQLTYTTLSATYEKIFDHCLNAILTKDDNAVHCSMWTSNSVHYILQQVHIAYRVNILIVYNSAFSALTLLAGWQEGHPACKNWVVGCWHGYLSGVRCRLAYGPADATATHCLLLQ